VVVAGVLVYYWTIFSGRIDNLLRGDVFTRSAGIYAAPKQLRPGEPLSSEELVAYLKRAGYVEKGTQAETTRGRFSINGSTVDVEPSQASTVDGVRQFQPILTQ
jgi:penicillin-binding protein 1B